MTGAGPTVILGLSSGFHDAAAALVVGGDIRAAVEEERLSRVKHDAAFPARAAAACLEIAGLHASDVDAVACHEKPLGVLNRHLTSRLSAGPAGVPGLVTRTPEVVRQQLGLPGRVDRWFRHAGARPPAVRYCEHHTSHLAAAFYPSPFAEAAVVAIDGVGEQATCSVGLGRGRTVSVEREVRYPHSAGLLYSAFTSYCGFRVSSGEGELMGLAPFGRPRYADRIREHLVHLADDGSFAVDQRYFAYTRGRRMTNARFHHLFGGPPRPLGAPPGQREADLAASVQQVLEEIVLGVVTAAHALTGARALCLAGGVALNCVANGRVQRDGPFDEVWIQPAPGDAGSAVGAALWLWHDVLGRARCAPEGDAMGGSFLGPRFTPEEVRAELARRGIEHEAVPDDAERCRVVAEHLADGRVVGWFTGRMEFGPRALGHRSILADPRSTTVQRRLNEMVKERATFRPFAPAVLAEHVDEWFGPGATPYMTATTQVHDHRPSGPPPDRAAAPADPDDLRARVAEVRSTIPAVTHVDGSARTQVVDPDRNPAFARLLRAFADRTGCPVLLNTSFNARDEPIVCTPADAVATAERVGLDLLVLEDCLVRPTRGTGP